MPRAGRNFTFGIIEGPDRNVSSGGPFVASQLTLTALSTYDGSGTVTSPSGYSQPFSFTANHPTIIDLPHNLTHQTDLGKTAKGVLVHTTRPVNLVLEDSVVDAGDASQIYPDDGLDTNYVVSEWGLWNDIGENNRVEFLVTASQDSTHVSIVPSSMTMLIEPSNVSIEIMLMKGECYMVKADSNSRPKNIGLSGSTVRADKPVSVMVGTTCAYVPAGVQSCNELMDELIGRKWWGTHFFVQPLGNVDSMVELLLTGDTDFVAIINGTPSLANGKRLVSEVRGAAEILATVPVEVHQLTRGSELSPGAQGDPTLVTILPVSQYSDTMIWVSPNMLADLSPFTHWAPIIFPTAAYNSIMLDGVALAAIPATRLAGVVRPINASAWSAINPIVSEGVHTLCSPVPIFALCTGFQLADAYSFIPGTVLPLSKPDGTQGLPTESANESASLAVSIYPNPSSTYVRVIGAVPLSDIGLVDPLGREVIHIATISDEYSFDVEHIPAGTYTLVANSRSSNAQGHWQISIIH